MTKRGGRPPQHAEPFDCVSDSTSGGPWWQSPHVDEIYRDSFWLPYLRDPRPFEEIVREGIRIRGTLTWTFGMGIQGSYGQLSAGEAGRLFAQWLADPAKFEGERPKKIVEAVLEWGRDAEIDEARAREAWDALMRSLPTPPEGYHWHEPHDGCFPMDVYLEREFLLWSTKLLGYPPRGGG